MFTVDNLFCEVYMSEYRQIETEKVRYFCGQVFNSYGFNSSDSNTITDVLIRADLYGSSPKGCRD